MAPTVFRMIFTIHFTQTHPFTNNANYLANHSIAIRVARWNIFLTKIPILVYVGVPWNGKFWYILWPFRIFYGHLMLYHCPFLILLSFGTFFSGLVY
jgi:hypothetical protein